MEDQRLKENYLRSRGWSLWYHSNAWVNQKTVADKNRQDYTNYAMPLEVAFEYEKESKEPFKSLIDFGRLI